MPQPIYDTLIIGQGLAGSALAWHLIEQGERVCVVDDGHRSSSSMVAAGLINPLAGMRFNLRPQVPDWLRAAEQWYAKLEEHFGSVFYHPVSMLRLFRSEKQRRFYDRRLDDAECTDLIGRTFTGIDCPEAIAAPHGGFVQNRTGYVDLPRLLDALREWLRAHNALHQMTVDADGIRPGSKTVTVNDLSARRLVFCDGARVRENPWFDWLPLTPDKGEILDLNDSDWQPRHIINGAHWLVPLADGQLRFGATHEHTQLNNTPTTAARADLLAGFRLLCPDRMNVAVVAHRAGIRPATSDRYPFVGMHPQQPLLWIFNGFGARGALSIPWYARCLSNHMHNGSTLPVEADIRRL